jgi:hypothetical protein
MALLRKNGGPIPQHTRAAYAIGFAGSPVAEKPRYGGRAAPVVGGQKKCDKSPAPPCVGWTGTGKDPRRFPDRAGDRGEFGAGARGLFGFRGPVPEE